MARTTNITFGQVAQIADTLKAAGTRPTARAVRERIGSGSMGTIHKLLQQWQGKVSTEDDETEASTLPDHIQAAIMEFVGTEIATACEPINDELQEAKQTADELAQENERLSRTIESLEKDSYNAEMARAEALARDHASQNELAEAKAECAKLRQTVSELTRELDRSQRQTEMLANLQPDLVQARKDLAESNAGRADAERNAAVLAARLDATSNTSADLTKRLDTAEKKINVLTEDAKQANNHYQACAARLEAAAREIETLRKPKATPKPATVKKTPTKAKE